MTKSTKPKGATSYKRSFTSYKETAFGVLPRSKIIPLEAEVISLLAWFQHRVVWIHPFNDYNGRIARLLTNFLVLNFGLPTLEIKAGTEQDRQKYIKAMEEADKHNLSKLENLLAKALEENLRKV